MVKFRKNHRVFHVRSSIKTSVIGLGLWRNARTVHWTLNNPNKNAIPSFQPPVWLTKPPDPNTYEAACISDRGVVARRTMMMTVDPSRRDQQEVRTPQIELTRTERRAEVDKDEACSQTCEPACGQAILRVRERIYA